METDDRWVTAEPGNAFLLTREGMAHAPAGKEGEYAVGYPIHGHEYRMDRSFVENGWVEEGTDPHVQWASDKQINYARRIAENTGHALPEVLDKNATHAYISAHQEESRQIGEKQTFDRAVQMADALGIPQDTIGGAEGASGFVSTHLKEYRKWERSEIVSRVSINDYASSMGYEVVPVGNQNTYTIKGMDSMRITNGDRANGVWIRNSQEVGGSVIDFAMTFKGLSYADALDDLRGYMNGQTSTEHLAAPDVNPSVSNTGGSARHNLRLAEHPKDSHMRNVYAYLIKTRNIDPDIVTDMTHRKMLYQDTHKNCVFVSYDNDKANFACMRGTNTEKKFVADVGGCDYSKGWYVNNGADKLVVCEAPIDAMSVMSALNRAGENYKDYNYLALSGVTKMDALSTRVGEGQIKEVYLAFDNDAAGRNAVVEGGRVALKASPDIKITECQPQGKDWNSDLVLAGAHGTVDVSSFVGDRMMREAQQNRATQTMQRRQTQELGGLSM